MRGIFAHFKTVKNFPRLEGRNYQSTFVIAFKFLKSFLPESLLFFVVTRVELEA